jgi:2-polyprenyl-3-methyl-5-hydroxy-6-metoxy-1,4-benzoquinol methylase
MGFSCLKGIDISKTNISKALEKNIDCILLDVTEEKIENSFNKLFDIIIMMDIVEHIPDVRRQ